MGTKNNPGEFDCYANAEPDEPMFVLLGRDMHAPRLVEAWAEMREDDGEKREKVLEAIRCAAAMRDFRVEREKRKANVPSALVGPDANRLPTPSEIVETAVRNGDLDPAVLHARRMRARPKFSSIFLDLARALSGRSTCRRLAVGCVITSVDHRKVLSVGYNGGASGHKNDCDGDEPGKCGCLHAEENAVINADCPRATQKIVYCTHEPCLMCAKRLINMGGVLSVIYAEPYRLHDGVDLLQHVGIQCIPEASLGNYSLPR